MASKIYDFNPIQGVRAQDETNTAEFVKVIAPSKYEYNLQDLSANGAGRTESNYMHKKRSGQVVKLAIEWHNVRIADCAHLLQTFDPEYVDVVYLDAKAGGYKTECFYVSDRKAPLFNAKRGVWESVLFSLISRSGEVRNVSSE